MHLNWKKIGSSLTVLPACARIQIINSLLIATSIKLVDRPDTNCYRPKPLMRHKTTCIRSNCYLYKAIGEFSKIVVSLSV